MLLIVRRRARRRRIVILVGGGSVCAAYGLCVGFEHHTCGSGGDTDGLMIDWDGERKGRAGFDVGVGLIVVVSDR